MAEIVEKVEEITPCVLKPRPARETYTCPGSGVYVKAKLSIVDGVKVAEPGEVIDLQKTIERYRSLTDIATIVAKFQAGDESVINVNPNGISGDLSLLPHDINDIVRADGLFDKAKSNFDSLPDDIKKLFNNSPAEFFDAVLNNKVDSVLASYKPVVESKKEGDE